MNNKHSGPTHWYRPMALLRTAYRAITARNVAGMLDRRELMAALDPFDERDFNENHDWSQGEELWVDYIADTGDGWRTTHAVARMLAAESLEVEQQLLQRGRLLIIGGDLVYPVASNSAYSERLNQPFLAANREAAKPGSEQSESGILPDSHIYALPGNHDWYDGLTAFAHRFCARRPARGAYAPNEGHIVCGRRTSQTRSYFALKLPGDWWLCGVDHQLDHWIDNEQLAFFAHLAQNVMTDRSNILLCAPSPEWLYVTGGRAHRAFDSLSYLIATLDGRDAPRNLNAGKRQHRIRALISGDTHNYTRYEERPEQAKWEMQYLACGLGGAFTHPTNWTNEAIRFRSSIAAPNGSVADVDDHERVLKRRAAYPSPGQSSRLVMRNLAFGVLNWEFAIATGLICLFCAWLTSSTAQSLGLPLFSTDEVRWATLRAVGLTSPWPLIAALAVIFGTTYFATARGIQAWIVGFAHGLVHVSLWLTALFYLSAWADSVIGLLTAMFVYGLLVPPLTFGLYLIGSLLLFHAHWNEAFSSLRIPHYKGFLRIRAGSDGSLEIYPVGCDRVSRSDVAPMNPKLIEPKIVLGPEKGE